MSRRLGILPRPVYVHFDVFRHLIQQLQTVDPATTMMMMMTTMMIMEHDNEPAQILLMQQTMFSAN